MSLTYKTLSASAAIVLTVAMYVPYITSIKHGRTKPHTFSWLIWTLSAFVVFLAQLRGGAGVGAWPIGVSSLVTAYVGLLAYRSRGDITTTNTDWVCLAIALATIPCWLVTSDPLIAVVLLTGIELVGFGPTFRYAYSHPYQERLRFYFLGAFRNGLAVVAIEQYSLTTALFPAMKAIIGLVLIAMLGFRRKQIRSAMKGRSSSP